MQKIKEFNVYFYNGFGKPELVAVSRDQLENEVIIQDNYLGDLSEDLREELKYVHFGDIEELNSVLYDYGMVVNPSLQDLVENFGLCWFDKDSFPYEQLSDFGTPEEIFEITNRNYDDFKMYYGYENKIIIEGEIRFKFTDTVIAKFDSFSEAETFMNEENLWEWATVYKVNHEGRAYYAY